MIKLILTDMDNTLLPTGQEHVSYRAITAIRALLDLGVRFGPATGRDAFELDQMFFGARDCYQTGIVANGKRLYVDGELRHHSLLDNDALRQVAHLLAETPNAFLTALPFDNPRGTESYRCIGARPGDLAWFEQWIGFTGRPCDEVPDERLIAATIACSGTQEQLDELLACIRREVPCFDYVQPFEHWVDILPAGLNKGTALSLLLDEMGLTADEVLFFGDADNDVSLLLAAGQSVAVADATPAAAAAARWRIGASADDAVAQALEDVAEALRSGGTPRFMDEGYQQRLAERMAEEEAYDEDPAEGLTSQVIQVMLANKLQL